VTLRHVCTADDLARVLDRITLGPGSPINLVDFELGTNKLERASGFLFFRLVHERPDSTTGKVGYGYSGFYCIESGSHPDAVIKTAWKALRQLVEHELMEAFMVDDVLPFDPHASIDTLINKEKL